MPCESHSVRLLSFDKRFYHARKRIRGINSVLSIDFERNLCFTLILSNFDILLSFYASLKFRKLSILSCCLTFWQPLKVSLSRVTS